MKLLGLSRSGPGGSVLGMPAPALIPKRPALLCSAARLLLRKLAAYQLAHGLEYGVDLFFCLYAVLIVDDYVGLALVVVFNDHCAVLLSFCRNMFIRRYVI